MKHKKDTTVRICLTAVLLLWGFTGSANAESGNVRLVQAVMCESIVNFQPANPAVVFSMSQGEVFCYSEFDSVLEKTVIFHKWYKRDKLIFTMPLTLQPPKWSSFSRVQIRGEDKGPWRVEIVDQNGTRLKILRFSMAD